MESKKYTKNEMLEIAELFFKENDLSGFDRISHAPKILSFLFFGFHWVKQFEVLKNIYLQKFIPAVEELDKETTIELSKSEIGKKLNLESKMKYEIIGFGYISLFHKYENFARGLTGKLDQSFSSFIDINKVIKEQYQFDIIKPTTGIGYKVNWVCNCIKHQNGIASKRNHPPDRFIDYPKNQYLEIEPNEFKEDCDRLKLLSNQIFTASGLLAIMEEFLIEDLEKYRPLFKKIKEI